MKRCFLAAIKELGTTDYLSAWMLPDGTFLNYPDGQDHRWVGQWCKDGYEGWREWLMQGGVCVGFSHKAPNYIAIRTSGLNPEQRMAFEEMYELGVLSRVDECYFEEYEFTTLYQYKHQADTMKDAELIRLRLTDTIGYQMEMSQRDREMEDLNEDY